MDFTVCLATRKNVVEYAKPCCKNTSFAIDNREPSVLLVKMTVELKCAREIMVSADVSLPHLSLMSLFILYFVKRLQAHLYNMCLIVI